uniref:Uncharacterized protein n=1 Tax=uncultured prokaryote TaxID=198431 RepID=A0A0H5Q3U2_9ZZZZ|nr:hypothetical protein [uncultured prokaryote]
MKEVRFEGLYYGGTGLVLCYRERNPLVPHFRNLIIRPSEISRDELSEIYRLARDVEKYLETAPWAVDDHLPGID